jgi:hypothetical protein
VHIFRIHPKSLKNYRDALQPSGAKDDPTDAELLLHFLMLHQHRLKPWLPDKPEIRWLIRLVELRRKVVGKRVRLTNELTQLLKEYFPGALDWAGKIDRAMTCDFLSKRPTLEKLQKSKPETIRRFYQEHGVRLCNVTEGRLKQIRSAIPLTRDEPVIETSVLMVRTIVPQLHWLIDGIAQFDESIERIRRNFQIGRFSAAFQGLVPPWHRACSRLWDPTGTDSALPARWRNPPALHRLPSTAENQSGYIVASPARSSLNEASMSLPANQSSTAPGPVPITIISERKVKVIMPPSGRLHSDGFQ